MKRITLCADDYAIHPAASEAILNLVELQRIQATSCLVTSSSWHSDAKHLSRFRKKADIGLHLNFTEGAGLTKTWRNGLPGLKKMLLFSHLRCLNPERIKEEVMAQYQAFVDATGHHPDFIDGHQHVHHLPVVRNALVSVLQEQMPENHSTWVRSVSPLIGGNGLKKHVITNTGAAPLRRILREANIGCNKAFAGVYSLAPNQPFRSLMQGWLAKLPDRGLIMCHPGKVPAEGVLDHAEARQQELEYLASDSFLQDCKSRNVSLIALSQT